jgi:hypothetical protein
MKQALAMPMYQYNEVKQKRSSGGFKIW